MAGDFCIHSQPSTIGRRAHDEVAIHRGGGVSSTSRSAGRTLLIGAGLILLIGLGVTIIVMLWSSPLKERLMSIGELGPSAPIVYALVFAIGTVLFLPGSILSLVAGALFGPFIGSLVVFFGASVGATAAFLIARNLIRHRIEDRLRSTPTLEALDHAVSADGLMTSILVRLSPVIPFNLLNYVLGGTSMRFTHFLLGLIAMLPATILYVSFGALASDLAGIEQHSDFRSTILTFIGIMATLVVVIRLQKGARERLDQVLVDEDA